MSDSFWKLIEHQERLRKLTEPYRNLVQMSNSSIEAYNHLNMGSSMVDFATEQTSHFRALSDIYGGSAFSRMMEDIERNRVLLETPVMEAQKIGLLNPSSDITSALLEISATTKMHDEMFRLPIAAEMSDFVTQATEASKLAQLFASELDRTNALTTTMKSLTHPWAHVEHTTSSVAGITDLLALGQGLSQFNPYEEAFANIIRSSLGDWRDEVDQFQDNLYEPVARTRLYREQGVDPNLTDFPADAFHEALEIIGLDAEGDVAYSDQDEIGENHSLERAEKVFRQIRHFERAIRKFIETVMSDQFGEDWIDKRISPDMREKWEHKRQSDMKAGNPGSSLIEYADFTDYRMIIERRDNWREVFSLIFQRQEDIRESLQRLQPVRIATMHSRLVTMDDELLLIVETRRVLKAIGITPIG